jgi:hypothetical protein
MEKLSVEGSGKREEGRKRLRKVTMWKEKRKRARFYTQTGKDHSH